MSCVIRGGSATAVRVSAQTPPARRATTRLAAIVVIELLAVMPGATATAQSPGQPTGAPISPAEQTAGPCEECPVRVAIGGFANVNDTQGESGGALLVGEILVMNSEWRRWQPGLGFRLTTDHRRWAMAFDLALRAQRSATSRWYAQAMAGVDLAVVNRDEPVGRNDVFVSLELGRPEGLALAGAWELPVYGDGEGAPERTGRPEWFAGVKCGGYPGLLGVLDFAAAIVTVTVRELFGGA